MFEAPIDIVRAFAEAWSRQDADAVANLFVEDAGFVNVTGMWWHDRERIRAAHARGFEVMFPEAQVRLGRTDVRMLGADAAVVHARWHMKGQIKPDGSPAGDRSGVISFVATRTVDGWLAVSAHNTDTAPGRETHIASDGGLTAERYA
ncbi:MAG: SgcJ/EcaC family oxidoreductase [Propionibacteriaceae bacterium]|nr:SgcJ/EcaC family oxidoreductase [Propionibacteriaceae bacterium]